MKSTLYLCGAGNPEGVRLALRINEKEKKWDKVYILDDDPGKSGKKILGVEIIGPFSILGSADPEKTEVANLVAGTTKKRKEAYEKIAAYKVPLTSLIDPAVDLFGIEYEGDIIIYPNVIFAAGAFLNQGSVVFTGAVVGHGCVVGKFCILAPGAVLNARVVVEDGVYIGTNASVLPDLKIGSWATVGLNSGVINNIPSDSTVMGVPAEVLTLPEPSLYKNQDEKLTSAHESNAKFKHIDESVILKIWKELLKTEAINLNDNFFDKGGSSLLAVQLFGRLKNELNIKINLIDVFHYSTINSFMEFLEKQNATVSEIVLSGDSKRVTFFRQRFTRLASENPGDPDEFSTKEFKQE